MSEARTPRSRVGRLNDVAAAADRLARILLPVDEADAQVYLDGTYLTICVQTDDGNELRALAEALDQLRPEDIVEATT